jgi:hypothetical protein
MSAQHASTSAKIQAQSSIALPNAICREGERSREPQLLWNAQEIRARGDARPPNKQLGNTPTSCALGPEEDQQRFGKGEEGGYVEHEEYFGKLANI